MESRKIVFKETAIVLAGQVICVAAMLGIYALLDLFSTRVLLGGIVGSLLAVANFFLMAVGASLAADKAQDQNVKGGKMLLQMSMSLRYIVLFIALFAFAKSGICDPVAMVLPIAFVRPIISFGEFFRKSGDKKQ